MVNNECEKIKKGAHIGNYPPMSEETIKTMVEALYENQEENLVVEMTDEEILKIVKKFLSMRRWINEGKFPLFCSTCGKPMNYVGFTYRGEKFLFWHCFDCHMKPDFEENEQHVTFEEFKELLQYLINQRKSRHE